MSQIISSIIILIGICILSGSIERAARTIGEAIDKWDKDY